MSECIYPFLPYQPMLFFRKGSIVEIEYQGLVLTLSRQEVIYLRDLLLVGIRNLDEGKRFYCDLTKKDVRALCEFGRNVHERLNI